MIFDTMATSERGDAQDWNRKVWPRIHKCEMKEKHFLSFACTQTQTEHSTHTVDALCVCVCVRHKLTFHCKIVSFRLSLLSLSPFFGFGSNKFAPSNEMIMFKHSSIGRPIEWYRFDYVISWHSSIGMVIPYKFMPYFIQLKANKNSLMHFLLQILFGSQQRREKKKTRFSATMVRNVWQFYWVCRTDSTDTLSLLSTAYYNC